MFFNDDEAYNKSNLEAMPFQDLVKLILKLQRQISVAHEEVRDINRKNMTYNARLEREKNDASEYNDKLRSNLKDLCIDMHITAFTHTQRFTTLKNALNALNASNLCFRQQFSELCDDMKINFNNNQVSRYNDLRIFVNQLLASSNISFINLLN